MTSLLLATVAFVLLLHLLLCTVWHELYCCHPLGRLYGRRWFRLLGALCGVVLLVICFGLCSGCAGADPQRIAFVATDATGQAVNDAEKAFVAYERVRGAQALPGGNPQQISDWVRGDSAWKQYVPLVDKYNAAYTAWAGANAVAAGGTSDPSFKANVFEAAVDITAFVAQFVPSIKPLKAQ